MGINFTEIVEQMRQALIEKGLSEREADQIKDGIREKIENTDPPTIAIIGFTGVGKSSTLNALFNAGQDTSDVRACTQEARKFKGNIEPYTGNKGIVNIYDMPGLGESITKDKAHYKIYTRVLPECDVIVWTYPAGDRVLTPMQNALIKLVNDIGYGFTERLVFAINKADTIAPGEEAWNTQFNIPSPEQKINLKEREADIQEKVREVLPKWKGSIVSYSAKRRYHLDQLMTAMVAAMPDKKKWVLDKLADVADYMEMIPKEYRQIIEAMSNDRLGN